MAVVCGSLRAEMKKEASEKNEAHSEEDGSVEEEEEEVNGILDNESLRSSVRKDVTLSRRNRYLRETSRTEIKNSREKKFRRCFKQIPGDEQLLNYFSCALVSDILLQGRLYVTENYFAFYSNVIGFVTKLIIPTASVTRISKEKIVKFIPNAIGITTINERHVFGSFISRDAAFELLCSVCEQIDENDSLQKVSDADLSEECYAENYSCESNSGNENPTDVTPDTDQAPPTRRRTNSHAVADVVDSIKKYVSQPRKINGPNRKFNIIYLGAFLAILLACLSAYLFIKILEMESKMHHRNGINTEELARIDGDPRVSMDGPQFLINSHLDAITKLKKNLENLSDLIRHHDTLFEPQILQGSSEIISGDGKIILAN